MTKKVYCKDCKHSIIITSADCYATYRESKVEEDYVKGGGISTGSSGVVSCYKRNKKGNCKYYEEK